MKTFLKLMNSDDFLAACFAVIVVSVAVYYAMVR